MPHAASEQNHSTTYQVWDLPTRLFHWLNVLLVFSLIAVGLALLNDDPLGLSKKGMLLLKQVHVIIGYLFAINLTIRLAWGLVANRYSNWKTLLPFNRAYWTELNNYLAEVRKTGKKKLYLGHNPLAKLMVTFILLLLIVQAGTGLVLAGTDLYYPPFGHSFANWVTNAGNDESKLAALQPGSKEGADPQAYADMRAFRKNFKVVHYYVFYLLLVAIVLHISAVIYEETHHNEGLISSMVNGRKRCSEKPADLE